MIAHEVLLALTALETPPNLYANWLMVIGGYVLLALLGPGVLLLLMIIVRNRGTLHRPQCRRCRSLIHSPPCGAGARCSECGTTLDRSDTMRMVRALTFERASMLLVVSAMVAVFYISFTAIDAIAGRLGENRDLLLSRDWTTPRDAALPALVEPVDEIAGMHPPLTTDETTSPDAPALFRLATPESGSISPEAATVLLAGIHAIVERGDDVECVHELDDGWLDIRRGWRSDEFGLWLIARLHASKHLSLDESRRLTDLLPLGRSPARVAVPPRVKPGAVLGALATSAFPHPDAWAAIESITIDGVQAELLDADSDSHAACVAPLTVGVHRIEVMWASDVVPQDDELSTASPGTLGVLPRRGSYVTEFEVSEDAERLEPSENPEHDPFSHGDAAVTMMVFETGDRDSLVMFFKLRGPTALSGSIFVELDGVWHRTFTTRGNDPSQHEWTLAHPPGDGWPDVLRVRFQPDLAGAILGDPSRSAYVPTPLTFPRVNATARAQRFAWNGVIEGTLTREGDAVRYKYFRRTPTVPAK